MSGEGQAMDDNIDPMLRAFVSVVTEVGSEVGVTLLIGGAWISGVVIPPRMFTEEVRRLIERSNGKGLDGFFKLVGQHWFPSQSELDEDALEAHKEEAAARPCHIHLRHARRVTGEQIVPTDGGYLRVRMAAVEGWLVGVLGPQGYEVPPGPPPPE